MPPGKIVFVYVCILITIDKVLKKKSHVKTAVFLCRISPELATDTNKKKYGELTFDAKNYLVCEISV